jgi:hypothetical protein
MATNNDPAGDAGRRAVPGDSDAPLNDEDLTTKDRAYAPGSERETAAKQDDQSTGSDADTSKVDLLPGTGGPDDSGIVDVDPGEIHIPRSNAPGSRPV